MVLRPILQFPDKRLKEKSQPIVEIDEIDDELRALARDMLDVMYDEPGIGLAAPQLGESVRLAVVDTDWTDEDAEKNPTVALNPESRRVGTRKNRFIKYTCTSVAVDRWK